MFHSIISNAPTCNIFFQILSSCDDGQDHVRPCDFGVLVAPFKIFCSYSLLYKKKLDLKLFVFVLDTYYTCLPKIE